MGLLLPPTGRRPLRLWRRLLWRLLWRSLWRSLWRVHADLQSCHLLLKGQHLPLQLLHLLHLQILQLRH